MCHRRVAVISAMISLLFVTVSTGGAQPGDSGSRPIRIVNPTRLRPDPIPAERTPLGLPNDYKPWITRLKNG
ncbi:MAG: hypothetical protein FJX77_16715, partial [Armatimonadetes bacterium]|nr:hypothetical protein [Armatimonadota bacterium]